ncbi:MAG: GNAT family N-acetyltransferase [Gemmatimonadaceae bacterium]|nr:GNAT family N-acetyltransferase [Chitinophagaceae bacterium]
MNIRLASREDAALIASISRTTFEETFGSANTAANMEKFMSTQFNTELLEKEVGMPGNIFFIASDGDEPLGYARLMESTYTGEDNIEVPAIEIARIYALSSSIGKGVGSALMKKAIEIAYQENRKIIWLGVWEQNHRAIDFYTKWGFEKYGEHPFLLGDDLQTDWLMKKTL